MADEIDESRGGITCAICLERIQEDAGRMYGILENCDHTFCLSCIKRWRASNQQNRLMCPQCRTLSHVMIPSRQWFNSQEEKRAMIDRKLEEWSRRPCRFYRGGLGFCRYNEGCRFSHARDPHLSWDADESSNLSSLFNEMNSQNWVDIFATESDGFEFYIPVVMDNITSSTASSSYSDDDERPTIGSRNSATVDEESGSEDRTMDDDNRSLSLSTIMETAWCPEIEDYMLENEQDEVDSLGMDSDMLDRDDVSVGFFNPDAFDDEEESFEAAFLDDQGSVITAATLSSAGDAPHSVTPSDIDDELTDSWTSVSSDHSNSAVLSDPQDADQLPISQYSSSTDEDDDYYGSRRSSPYVDLSDYTTSAELSDNSGFSSISDHTDSLLTDTSSSAFSDFELVSDSQPSNAGLTSDSEVSGTAVVMVDDLVMRLDVLECSESNPPDFHRRQRS